VKIKFLATGIAPKKYEFDGEKIIIDGIEYDLSAFKEGDIFEGLKSENNYIRDIKRIDGELYVTLCQKALEGHWRGIDEWIDSKDYNPSELYIKEISEEELIQEQKELQGFEEMQIEGRSMDNNKGIILNVDGTKPIDQVFETIVKGLE